MKMKKRITLWALLTAMLCMLSGCNIVGDAVSSAVGVSDGKLNKTYSTKWFEFTVNSIKSAYEYSEFEATDGYKFVIVNVTEKNTFGEDIMMSCSDYQLFSDKITETDDTLAADPEYFMDEDGYIPQDVLDNVMPWDFTLTPGESATYDVVFIVPDEVTDISFEYLEINEHEEEGNNFAVKHTL